MDICLWIPISLLICFGGLFFIHYLRERLAAPVKGAGGALVHTVVAASGGAEALEHTVGGLLWLVRSGKLDCDIWIVDAGLNEEARTVAGILARDEPRVRLCGESVCFTEDTWRRIEP